MASRDCIASRATTSPGSRRSLPPKWDFRLPKVLDIIDFFLLIDLLGKPVSGSTKDVASCLVGVSLPIANDEDMLGVYEGGN